MQQLVSMLFQDIQLLDVFANMEQFALVQFANGLGNFYGTGVNVLRELDHRRRRTVYVVQRKTNTTCVNAIDDVIESHGQRHEVFTLQRRDVCVVQERNQLADQIVALVLIRLHLVGQSAKVGTLRQLIVKCLWATSILSAIST